MNLRRINHLAWFTILSLLLLLAAIPALAQTPPHRPPIISEYQAGNYCISCHMPGDPRLENPTAWNGSIEREEISPCPAASRVQEDIYYTERALLAISRARNEIGTQVDASSTDTRIAASRQSYSRMLDEPVSSLGAVESSGAVLRYRLGKYYNWLNNANQQIKRRSTLFWAAIVTLVVLLTLGWGVRNIMRHSGKKSSILTRFSLGYKAIIFVVLVFILFSLPIFRVPMAEVETPTEEEQARQTALDTAGRVAEATDRALARTWAMAHAGAKLSNLDPAEGEQALDNALLAAEETQRNITALWGESLAVLEGTVGSPADLAQAELISNQIEATNSRAWALRMIAYDWATLNPDLAEDILELALHVANGSTGIYRDLDIRAIAVTWARLNPDQAQQVTQQINDPAIRAWALWEIGSITGDHTLYSQAADFARQVSDPVEKARLLQGIGTQSGEEAFYYEAANTLTQAEGAAKAYALADLAAVTNDSALVEQISTDYPDARALALYRLGQFEPAWSAAAQIADPFSQARAQSAIAAAWNNAEAANQITDPTLRERALRDIAITNNDLELANSLESPYYRVQALTALGQYQAAQEAAADLSDTYPLQELAIRWAESNPQAALQVVDMMDAEADKAVAMRHLAVITGDDDIFERALNLALAARVSGNDLAPIQASLALGQAIEEAGAPEKAEAAYVQAYDIAEGLMIKYK